MHSAPLQPAIETKNNNITQNSQNLDFVLIICAPHTPPYMTVGVVAKCLVCLVKHQTTDIYCRTSAFSQVILHDLRSEEEHSLVSP